MTPRFLIGYEFFHGAVWLVGLLVDDILAGELQSVDGYMNIALEDTKEYVEGKLRRNYGDAFVRGNNGKFISVLL